jgi:hypothetical protein
MKNHAGSLLQLGIALVTVVVPAFAGTPQIPEPATVMLIGGGLGALILVARWKRARK